MIAALIKTRSSSLCTYTSSFPGLLAGLVHDEEAKRKESAVLFARHCRAWESALESTVPKVKELLSRHPLASTPMQFAMKFFKAGKYETVTAQLRSLLDALWGSVGQTKLVEDAIQKLRDHESRDSTNKTMCHMSSWEHLVTHELLKVHHRREVEIVTASPAPSNFGGALFVPVAKSGQGEHDQGIDDTKLDLQRIMGSADWVSFNAQSSMQRVGESHLLLELHRTGKWHMATRAWQSELLPESFLVKHDKGDFDVSLVVRSLQGAC